MARLFLLLGLIGLALLGPDRAFAQSDIASAVDASRAELDELRTDIDEGELQEPAAVEALLRDMRDVSRGRLASVERNIASLASQISALGAPPGENAPPEAPDLAAERRELNERLARLRSMETRINANIIESNDLLARISTSRVQRIYQTLATRGPSPLLPEVWQPGFQAASDTAGEIKAYFRKWAETRSDDSSFLRGIALIALALAAAVLLFGPVNRWIMATFSSAIENRRATPARRVVVAGLKMMARAAPGLIGGFIVLETLRAQAILTDQGEGPARALWFALIVFLLVSGFLNGLFAPTSAQWRIAPVAADCGRKISLRINAIVLVFGGKILLSAIFTATGADPSLTRLLDAATAIIVSVLLISLCRSRLWNVGSVIGEDRRKVEEGDRPANASGAWCLIRRLGRGFGALTIVAALTGYVDLADFLASRLYYLAILLSVLWFTRAVLLEFADYLWRRSEGHALAEKPAEEIDERRSNVRFWNSLLINSALFFAALPAIFVLAGFPGPAVRDGIVQAFFGFNIGGFQVPSLARLVVAIVIFFVFMALTRVAQRGFRAGPFAHSDIDTGVQNSLITLIGYAGLVVALFASISTIGFDLSNLALIAGALSLGIGFGLQSIVNNFVSGLILLFERPIKAGDWVVTASGEGTVKKISVRSTEIETFDRSSIIVPNSELVSSTVTNWTHRNKFGRIIVPIGVAYGSNAENVRDILLRCAREHPLVVAYPEPFVVWKDFGDSSLDFDVRAFLNDISRSLFVRSELRYAIYRALAEEGIEIPFPQRDIHVKSWTAPPPTTEDEQRDD